VVTCKQLILVGMCHHKATHPVPSTTTAVLFVPTFWTPFSYFNPSQACGINLLFQ